MAPQLYVIWSNEHEAWWASDECGYTRNPLAAGVYSDQRSREVVERANVVRFNETRVPLECIDPLNARLLYGEPQSDDEVTVRRIYARYSGKFTHLDLTDPDIRAQLALDLGMLVGLSMRLLSVRKAAAS